MEATAHSEEELREQAVKRLHKKRDFRTHVLMYVLVNAMLVTEDEIRREADRLRG